MPSAWRTSRFPSRRCYGISVDALAVPKRVLVLREGGAAAGARLITVGDVAEPPRSFVTRIPPVTEFVASGSAYVPDGEAKGTRPREVTGRAAT